MRAGVRAVVGLSHAPGAAQRPGGHGRGASRRGRPAGRWRLEEAVPGLHGHRALHLLDRDAPRVAGEPTHQRHGRAMSPVHGNCHSDCASNREPGTGVNVAVRPSAKDLTLRGNGSKISAASWTQG